MIGWAIGIILLICVSIFLQIGLIGIVGYILYKSSTEDEPILYKLPGPGHPLSEGTLLLPMDKVEEFRRAMEVETTAKISSSPPLDENNKTGGYV